MRSIVLACALVICGAAANAQQPQSCAKAPQLGTWALQSWVTEDLETHQKKETFGAHPTGYLAYGPDCRMYAILIKDGRKSPAALVPTDPEKIDLFNGLVSYAGVYTYEGDKVSHHIDSSWNQAWTGTTQVREFRIEGMTLHIKTLPSKSPVDGRMVVSNLVWTKVQ